MWKAFAFILSFSNSARITVGWAVGSDEKRPEKSVTPTAVAQGVTRPYTAVGSLALETMFSPSGVEKNLTFLDIFATYQ
jgi:hypothetical protein